MARPKKKWFRVYVEMTRDLKIRKLPPQHKWLWVAVLSAVCESPVNSKLMLSECLAVDEQTLSDYAGMRVQDVRRGLKNLMELNLIEWDDKLQTWSVPRWSERQFESDDVAIRVAKHRYLKQDCNVTMPLHETLQGGQLKQLCNAPDTDTDTDTELKELKKEDKFSFLRTQGNAEIDRNPDSARKTAPIDRATKTPDGDSVTSRRSSTAQPRQANPSSSPTLDLLFEAIANVCGIVWSKTTKSEIGELRKSHSQIKHANGTPDEVYRKAEIYHRMFPGAMLTPSALAKHWSRLEERNIPKTKAELDAEDLERTFERLSGVTSVNALTVGVGPDADNHGGSTAPDPLSVDGQTSATRNRTQLVSRAESAAPFTIEIDTHKAQNGHSGGSNANEHDFLLSMLTESR